MKVISGLFHPLLMATYMSTILYLFVPEAFIPYPIDVVPRLVLSMFFLTALFPSIFVVLLKLLTPFISDLELSNRKERLLPFIILMVFYAGAGKWLVMDLQLGHIIKTLLFSGTGMIGLMFLINIKLKISIHSAAIWAIAGYTLSLAMKLSLPELNWVIFTTIIAGGLIGTSRLHLGYHRPMEVWTGSVLGFFYSFFMAYAFL
ncbi:MAG: hypothetical protein GY816_23580 [Cytophagales bacterium]|nr:hypothetical protein [Cytophagales bacterium]